MIQFISIPLQKIRYRNFHLRRLFVTLVEIIFVHAGAFPVGIQNDGIKKACLIFFSSKKARPWDQSVIFQDESFRIE